MHIAFCLVGILVGWLEDILTVQIGSGWDGYILLDIWEDRIGQDIQMNQVSLCS